MSQQGESAEDVKPGYTIWDRPGYLVRRLHQIHVAMFLENVANGEMTPIQYGLLSILATRPNIDQFTIGEELGLDRANVAGILQRLESRKLITRVVDPENRRRKICLATAKGLALVKRYDQQMQECQKRLLSPLNAAERESFMTLLSRLVEANNESGRTSLKPNGEAFAPTQGSKARDKPKTTVARKTAGKTAGKTVEKTVANKTHRATSQAKPAAQAKRKPTIKVQRAAIS